MTISTNIAYDAIHAAMCLFDSSDKKVLFAKILGKDPNCSYEQSYLNSKVEMYGRNFVAFWAWLDTDSRKTFVKMALDRAGLAE